MVADSPNMGGMFASVRSTSGAAEALIYPREEYGEWHHYTMTVTSSTLCFYVDGILKGDKALHQLGNYYSSVDYIDIGRSR